MAGPPVWFDTICAVIVTFCPVCTLGEDALTVVVVVRRTLMVAGGEVAPV